MSKLMIRGIEDALKGAVTLSGAKNSALKILVASVLAGEEIVLDNIPLDLLDIQIKLNMLISIGADLHIDHPGRVRISWPDGKPLSEVSGEFGSVRTSLLFLGALLARTGRTSVPLPGGCQIGERKYDLHIMALEKYGAVCVQEGDLIRASARQLVGTEINFPIRTTGGTENAILAGCAAKGYSHIYNAHTRPEVLDLIEFLKMLGARITVHGSGLIEIEGVSQFAGGHYSIIFDNMEAITYAVFASIVKGSRVRVRYFPIHDLEIPMIFLRESGVKFIPQGDSLTIERQGLLTPFDLSTGTYPGINSDMQPLFAVLATQAEGESRITDIRFSDRFQYVIELRKMGAEIEVQGNTVIVRGPTKLKGVSVNATDLRGGAALIAAALVADGITTIDQVEQVDRGYEHLDEKLSLLGVEIYR